MAAESTGPVRRTGRVRRAKPGSSEAELQPADATPPAGAFVALTGLAMAAGTAGSPDRLRTGLHALGPRPKLMVGRADDQAEVEADAMADAVLHRLLQPPTTDLEHAGESESVIGPLRRAAVSALAPMARRVTGIGAEGGEVDSQTEQSLRAASSTGAPLAPAVRREYEDAFGADLSAVRVHSGPASAQLNSALGAQAFTLGSDIYFGNRVPSTAAAADRHLMAHELAHTLQDGGGVHRAMVRRLAVQITPTWQQAEDEEMIEQAVLPSAEAQPHTDTQPHIEALLDEGANSSGETMMLEPMVTEGRPTKAWELVIESVAIVGRPTTLFTGSMGDHMTAFVISRKGVENAVFGQPFPVAVKELDDLVADLKKLPGWDLVDSLKPAEDEEVLETTTEGATTEVATTQGEDISSALASSALVLTEAPDLDVEEGTPRQTEPYRRASHHARFREAEQNLANRRLLLHAADTDDLKVLRLQDYVAAYLELRELIPLSASNWLGANRGKGGKGDGETGLEGFLAEPGEQRPGSLRRDFLSTIATYRMAQAAIEPNKDALAILMPGLDHALTANERTELMARQHVQSVLSNFPQNFAGLADDVLLAERRERKRVGKGTGEGSASTAEAERDQDANFTIILDHLTRIVRMRYPEVAEKEYAHQLQVAKLARREDRSDDVKIAEADAAALAKYLKTPEPTRAKASTLTKEEKDSGRVDKRQRDSSSEAVGNEDDELYQELSATQAKKVYTGRDGFKKSRTDTPSPLPKSDLAVQLLLDDTGAILRPVVGRQGKYTKGAHTIPWVQWVLWLSADIIGKQPAEALAAFTTTTAPAIRTKLTENFATTTAPEMTPTEAVPTLMMPTEALPTLMMPTEALPIETVASETMTLEIDEPKEEAKDVEQPVGSMPLIELQVAIADLLDEITEVGDSSVLDATDTGGKGEAYHRVELRAYEKGERAFTPEELVAHILALCDVGQADSRLAERTVKLALIGAEQDYPQAYAASLISTYGLEDLADRASIGKEGVYNYESEADSESESDSDSEERKRSKKRKKRLHNGK